MIRLLAAAAALGVIVASTVAYQLRDQVAYAPEPPPHTHENPSDYLRATVSGCVDAGGTWHQGTEDGVFVGRCYPVPNIGIGPVVARRTR